MERLVINKNRNMSLNNIFSTKSKYSENEIYKIANKFNLSTTDCIKDDNEITVALNEEAEPSWIFKLTNSRFSKQLLFEKRWSEFD